MSVTPNIIALKKLHSVLEWNCIANVWIIFKSSLYHYIFALYSIMNSSTMYKSL